MLPLDMVAAVRTLHLSVSSGREVGYTKTQLASNRFRAKNNEKPIKAHQQGNRQLDSTKRGRPRADVVSALILEGSATEGKIRCKFCTRLFPREKSLQAHMRTHTGERPYVCDFPGCRKAFCQSGQLKTHQRLHTGEKPFVCSVSGCKSRFTHANRHCSDHPYASLQRVETQVLMEPEGFWEYSDKSEVLTWLQKQAEQRQSKSPVKETSQKLKRKHSAEDEEDTSDEDSISNTKNFQNSAIQTVPDIHKDQQDKWISALALIELATGSSMI